MSKEEKRAVEILGKADIEADLDLILLSIKILVENGFKVIREISKDEEIIF